MLIAAAPMTQHTCFMRASTYERPVRLPGSDSSPVLLIGAEVLPGKISVQGGARAIAMIYLHSTDERQRALTDAVQKAARAELRKVRKKPAQVPQSAKYRPTSGTKVARGGGQES